MADNAAKKPKKEEKIFDFGSIKFRTWLYFLLMAIVILVVLWVIELFFFKAYYSRMKRAEAMRVGDKLVDVCSEESLKTGMFELAVREAASNNGASVLVFLYDKNTNILQKIAYASAVGVGESGDVLLDYVTNRTFMDKVDHAGRSTAYITAGNSGQILVYGAARDAGAARLYVCMVSPFVPMDATTAVLRDQLVIVTCIVLVLSIILSFFISTRISKPITEFSRVARQLGRGDYSVRFVGNGYTEINDLADTLNTATEEMGKTEQLRRDFLANVSHDLRTPLTMVKAYAEMIRDISGQDASKRTQHAQVIIDEADRLTLLVGDILNLSKLQSKTEALTVERVDMGALARAVLERFNIMSEKGGYIFESDIQDGCIVMGDQSKLEQVMYNLIGNAVNYTGGDKRVVVRVKKGFKVCVEVRDTGKGIPPEEIDTVWDRYYRRNENKRSVVGSGLGLSIVKNILTAHKAEFGIDSTVGEGSAFWFKLPVV